ncbi:hypothetical protein WNY77_13525 [Paraglaciecola mesophila]|uniref:Uncharacterized protein n=1 Tax=Paraglaciecola mesophila TaxID=197222 RepID=A0ABU9SY51_9ALTE
MTDINLEKLDVGRFEKVFEGGTLTWSITEWWTEITDETVRCGAKIDYETKKKIGVVESEKVQFENTIKGSLGPKAIAQILASSKESAESEVSWEIVQEEKRIFSFQAPLCGSYHALQYQKCRGYYFEYKKKGILKTDSWELDFTEYTKQFHDASVMRDPDPNCNCPNKEEQSIDGIATIKLGELTMDVGYKKIPEGIKVFMNNKKANIYSQSASRVRTHIPRSFIPENLRFLCSLKEEDYEALLTLHPFNTEEKNSVHQAHKEDASKESTFER